MIFVGLLLIALVGTTQSVIIYGSPGIVTGIGNTDINDIGNTVITGPGYYMSGGNVENGNVQIINSAIPENTITIINNQIYCGYEFVCSSNAFACTISQHTKSNDSVIVTSRSCCDSAGIVGEKNVTQTPNPYLGLPLQIFAIANLNGTVWSCNSCNVTNITQANELIAQQNKAEEVQDAISAVTSAVSEIRSGIESERSRIASGIESERSRIESGLESELSNLESAISSS